MPQELRAALTVLPVGPRGSDVLTNSTSLCFAVQLAAGYAEAADPQELQQLWPWKLVTAETLSAWLVDETGVNAPVTVPVQPVAIVDDAFAQALQQRIADAYADPGDVDVRLLFPGEADNGEEYQRRSFSARSQYLCTLPGELSRRLRATLYLTVDRDALFENPGAGWVPRGDRLWITPSRVTTPAGDATLTGAPTFADGRFEVSAMAGALPVRAAGPGFRLDHFLNFDTTVFDLKEYKVAIKPGDRRFATVESLLLDVLEPFGELDHLRAEPPDDKLTIAGAAARPLPRETLAVLFDLWRTDVFRRELSFVFPPKPAGGPPEWLPDGIAELARLLLPPDAGLPALTVPARWGDDFGKTLADPDLLAVARTLAARLGMAATELRPLLHTLGERTGTALAAAWLAQAFDETVTATATVSPELRDAWAFGGASGTSLAERRTSLAQAAIRELRERREVPPLLVTLRTGNELPDGEAALKAALGDQLEKAWIPRLDARVHAALVELKELAPGESLLLDAQAKGDLAAAHLEAVWRINPHGPELPGRGLALTAGSATGRFAHEEHLMADGETSPYREVAGVLLLGRRGRDETDLGTREWRLLTGGVPMLGEPGEERLFTPEHIADEEWLPELLPIPVRPVFQQKVARADLEYHGQPLLAQSALDRAYRAEEYGETAAGGAPAYSFQSPGSFASVTGMAAAAAVSRAPALRYGDVYEFRGAVVDQAGGLLPSLARAGEPWRLDPAKAAAATGVVEPLAFRRSVPPGEVNVFPPRLKEKPGAWPALPGDVSLRAREWWGDVHAGADMLPALLFSAKSLAGTLPSYDFKVALPSIDEHTLTRWAIPPLGEQPGALDVLKAALSALLADRATQDPKRVPLQLHDPAVRELAFRLRGAGGTGAIVAIEQRVTPGDSGPHQRETIDVHVQAATGTGTLDLQADGPRVTVIIPDGAFAALEIFPLVPQAEFDARFAPRADFGELIDRTDPFPGHVAFRPAVILLEGATDALPSPAELYAALTLEEQSDGDVAVRFAAGSEMPALAYVDRFAIERERWIWRNLPLGTKATIAAAHEKAKETNQPCTDCLRLAASGPPEEAFDAATRDLPEGPVAEWERLAAFDRGFVDRGEVAGRWPRIGGTETKAGGPASVALLGIDNRDAMTAADYLRYGLRVRSRYAGVLPAPARERSAALSNSPGAPVRRRIAVGFRGQTVKPPKILALVPLTASLEQDPLSRPPGVPPFLVLLDETFFREYGVGERIELHLALENLDFHEKPETAKVPYRTGALPDHWLRSREADAKPPYYRGLERTHAEDEQEPVALELFGPFGYSLDITASEALANASAFIAYPPRDVNAHWAMFARLRRVLDRPTAKRKTEKKDAQGEPILAQPSSKWSDVHALYTLPDVRLLAAATGPAPAIELTGEKARLRNLSLLLDPLAQPSGTNEPAKNSEASAQYRYYLLVSRVVPGAGHGFDAELPVDLWRLPLFDPAEKTGDLPPKTVAVELRPDATLAAARLAGAPALVPAGQYSGRIVEVLLNGRYRGPSRLDDAALHWRGFWDALLADDEQGEQDAAGMIRRVSERFAVLPR